MKARVPISRRDARPFSSRPSGAAEAQSAPHSKSAEPHRVLSSLFRENAAACRAGVTLALNFQLGADGAGLGDRQPNGGSLLTREDRRQLLDLAPPRPKASPAGLQ